MATLYYRPYTAEPINDDDDDSRPLPSEEALETVLPEYAYIFKDADDGAEQSSSRRRQESSPAQQAPYTTTVIDDEAREPRHQQQQQPQPDELDRYRMAVRKMGQDILALRERIRRLETENSTLKRQLSGQQNSSRLLLEAVDLEELPRADLIAKYVALKQKLSATTDDLGAYKDKVQKLQNDLIRKNTREEEYLKMGQVHVDQQAALQKLQEKIKKVKKLEETCQKQEKVIEKMEDIIDKRSTSNNSDRKENRVLIEENKRLRQELEDWKEQAKAMRNRSGLDDAAKLEYTQQIEQRDARIVSLEKQMAEEHRSHGVEKEQLMNTMQRESKAVDEKDDLRERVRMLEDKLKRQTHNVVQIPALIPVSNQPIASDTRRSDDSQETRRYSRRNPTDKIQYVQRRPVKASTYTP